MIKKVCHSTRLGILHQIPLSPITFRGFYFMSGPFSIRPCLRQYSALTNNRAKHVNKDVFSNTLLDLQLFTWRTFCVFWSLSLGGTVLNKYIILKHGTLLLGSINTYELNNTFLHPQKVIPGLYYGSKLKALYILIIIIPPNIYIYTALLYLHYRSSSAFPDYLLVAPGRV